MNVYFGSTYSNFYCKIIYCIWGLLRIIWINLLPVDPVASCVAEIKIRKNTVYTASSASMLNISCPVTYCKEIPVVEWIKIDDTSKFIHISGTNQVTITQEQAGLKDIVSYLSFRNISTDDNGIYRCMISKSAFSLESHNINVNVSGKEWIQIFKILKIIVEADTS